jgi:ATP-binding cassette subfamily B protein
MLVLLAAVAEVFGMGAALPLISTLLEPERIYALKGIESLIGILGLEKPTDLLLPIVLIFVICTAFAGVTRVTLLWFQSRLSLDISSNLCVKLYERTLYQPYIFHLDRNSSEVLAASQKVGSLAYILIQPVLSILSAGFMLIAIFLVLVALEPLIIMLVFFALFLIYYAVVGLTKKQIAVDSFVIAQRQTKITKVIQESLGGIRDIILDGSQKTYTMLFKRTYTPMQDALVRNQVVGGSPKFIIEALGMITLSLFAYFLATRDEAQDASSTIVILGVLALGAQRMLPLLQQIYSSYVTLKVSQESVQDALDFLDRKNIVQSENDELVSKIFDRKLILSNISYRYAENSPLILRNLNAEITRGDRVGLIGVSGSGKSTLTDVLMGLLVPTHGSITIDQVELGSENLRSWQSSIAHVPQSIFLADLSVAENIAFGVPANKIDLKRVQESAQLAQISQVIESWPENYDTRVGERGVRLSGGQRQRVGIARALYKRAKLIIFDEATSALDKDTEYDVVTAIESFSRDVTVLIVAHRLSALRACDYVWELKAGSLVAVTTK